jgi:hypothetical protein
VVATFQVRFEALWKLKSQSLMLWPVGNLQYVFFSVGSPAELYLRNVSSGSSVRVEFNGTTPFDSVQVGKYFVSDAGNLIAFDISLSALGRTGPGFAVAYRTLPDGLIQIAEPLREYTSASGFRGSDDGRYLVYTTPSQNYENNYAYPAIVDTTTGQVATLPGPLIQAATYSAFISSDGNSVAFVTDSRGLGQVDFDFDNDAYVCSRDFSGCKIASMKNGYYAAIPAAPVQPPVAPPVELSPVHPPQSVANPPIDGASPILSPSYSDASPMGASPSVAPSRAPVNSTTPISTSASTSSGTVATLLIASLSLAVVALVWFDLYQSCKFSIKLYAFFSKRMPAAVPHDVNLWPLVAIHTPQRVRLFRQHFLGHNVNSANRENIDELSQKTVVHHFSHASENFLRCFEVK